MKDWFVSIQGNEMGPYSHQNILDLIRSGQVTSQSLLWTRDLSEWTEAQYLPDFQSIFSTRKTQRPSPAPAPSGVKEDLESVWRVFLPATGEIDHYLKPNRVFWALLIGGCLPLVFTTVSNFTLKIYLFCIYFALIWGYLLKNLILGEEKKWGLALGSFFFTGLIGLLLHQIWYFSFEEIHDLLLSWTNSTGLAGLVSTFYFAFLEEWVKILPVLLCVKFWSEKYSIPTLMLIGIFSGLGFAAFENVSYTWRIAGTTANIHGAEGIFLSSVLGLSNQMVRAVSLCLVHASWTGIVTAFVVFVRLMRLRKVWGVFLSVMVASILHTLYNWFWGVQPILCSAVAAISFGLLLIYLRRIEAACDKLGILFLHQIRS